jgi:hypothetical protein
MRLTGLAIYKTCSTALITFPPAFGGLRVEAGAEDKRRFDGPPARSMANQARLECLPLANRTQLGALAVATGAGDPAGPPANGALDRREVLLRFDLVQGDMRRQVARLDFQHTAQAVRTLFVVI